MNPSLVIVAASVLGCIVSTISVFGVVWKGGTLLGEMRQSLQSFSGNVQQLTSQLGVLGMSTIENTKAIERTTAHLDALDGRVSRLERQRDQ